MTDCHLDSYRMYVALHKRGSSIMVLAQSTSRTCHTSRFLTCHTSRFLTFLTCHTSSSQAAACTLGPFWVGPVTGTSAADPVFATACSTGSTSGQALKAKPWPRVVTGALAVNPWLYFRRHMPLKARCSNGLFSQQPAVTRFNLRAAPRRPFYSWLAACCCQRCSKACLNSAGVLLQPR
jgi:tRNA G26 N,N-dimethylase Trm1